MSITLEDVLALEALETRLRAILPEQYQYSYENVLPVSMGSAGLKYDTDGRVAWNQIWATFCDLAMAGGPPHRGMLLEPAADEIIHADPENYSRVVEEIGRGVSMVTGLTVRSESTPAETGWIGFHCRSLGMAGWLVRAIVMENILARHDAEVLYLPAGPDFRLAKEIKNVITAVAKTCHYWNDHMAAEQQESIDRMFANAADAELLEPSSRREIQADPESYRSIVGKIAHTITERTGKTCFANRYAGWLGVEFPSDRAAIWLMRAMVVENVLSRREGSVLFLPVNLNFSSADPMERLIHSFEQAVHLLRVRKLEP